MISNFKRLPSEVCECFVCFSHLNRVFTLFDSFTFVFTCCNQFFSESQFESYRALGFEIMDELLNSVIRRLPNPGLPTIPAIVQRLRDDWRAETMP